MPLAEMPQTSKQHAVPQNIMDVEFKLIGDLTMRQFAYLMVFGGLAYFVSVTVVGIFKWPFVAILTILGLGLAFVPIQERGLDEWIVNFFTIIYTPTQRVWKKEPTIPSAFLYENLAVVKQELITLAPTSSRRKLEEYLHYQGAVEKDDPLDIPEREYAAKVRAAYADYVPEPSVGVDVYEPLDEEQTPIELPVPEDVQQDDFVPDQPDQEEEPQEEPQELPKERAAGQPSEEMKGEQKPEEGKAFEKPHTSVAKPEPAKVTPQVKKPQQKQKPKQSPDSLILPSKRTRPSSLMPLTPDRHSGRRFTNLLPYGGELVLPIRGEKVIGTTRDTEIEDDIQEKADKLKQLLSQIKSSEEYKDIPAGTPKTVEVPEEKEAIHQEAETIAEGLKQENDRLSEQIEKLKKESATAATPQESSSKEEALKKLLVQKEHAEEDYSKLKRQVLELQNRLKEKESGAFSGPSVSSPIYAKIQPLTGDPNVVSGIVKNSAGNIIEGLLLIIKNERGEAVRAFKTNSLGQFTLTTPLTNGLFTVEVSPSNNSEESFDIISIEAKGDVMPPIEIIGKK